MKSQACKKFCGILAVSGVKDVLLSNKIHTSTRISLHLRRYMGMDSRWTRLRTSDMRTSSMSSLIGRASFILKPIGTRDVLATSGAQMALSFSKVRTFFFFLFLYFPFSDFWQTSAGGLKARLSPRHPSEVHTGGFVRSPRFTLPWTRVPRLRQIIVDAGPFSHWNARVKTGNIRLTDCLVLILSSYASVLDAYQPTIRYVATNISTAASL